MAELDTPAIETGAPRGRRPRRRRARLESPRDQTVRIVEQTLEEKRRALQGLGQGIYYRVRRVWPVPAENQGTPLWVAKIPHQEGIDLELQVYEIGKSASWPTGKYLIEGCVEGDGTPRWAHECAYEFPPAAAAPGGGAASVKEQLRETAELVATVKTLTGEPPRPADMAATFADLLVKGMQLGKGPNPLEVLGPFVTPVMAVLGEVVKRITTSPPPPPASDGLEATYRLLERMGVVRRPEAAEPGSDMADQLAKQLDVAARIAEFFAARTGRGGAGLAAGPSVGAELVKALPSLAPYIGQLVTLGAQYLEVRRVEAARVAPGPPAVRAALPPPRPASEPRPTVIPAPPAATGGPAASPLAPFHRAIVEGEYAVFPALRDAIDRAGGTPLLQALRSGTLLPEALIAQHAAQLPELALPGAQEFLLQFIAWLRTGAFPPRHAPPPTAEASAAEPVPVGHYLAGCEQCEAEHVIPDQEDVASVRCIAPRDEAHPEAGLCGGALRRVEGDA